MRIRFKPWARKELEESSFYIEQPEEIKEKWRSLFLQPQNPFYVELGCGKGGFISKISVQYPEVNFLAVDLVDAMLGIAKRKIEESHEENEITNVYLTRFDIERIFLILGKEDKVDRIYINFCNPWPKGQHRKKRLTHPRQLKKYHEFLKEDGEIYFKTDDDELFSDSLLYFKRSGFEILKSTTCLEKEVNFWDNILTEHEEMFLKEGIKIKALIAKKKEND